MIDTVQIHYAFTKHEAQILLDMLTIPMDKRKVAKFLDDEQSFHFLPVPKREYLDNINPGILKMSFSHDDLGNYYLRFVINLESMLEQKRTNRLYRADDRNNELLRDIYARAIFTLFPNLYEYKSKYSPHPAAPSDDCVEFQKEIEEMYRELLSLEGTEAPTCTPNDSDFEDFLASAFTETTDNISNIPYLWLAKVKRVDYSVNIWVEDKDKFLRYAKKTFYPGGRLKMRSFKGNNNVYSYNKSRRVLLYDKQLKYKDFGCTDETLADEAKNVVRYEVRLDHIDKRKIITCCELNLENIGADDTLCGLLPFLNEELAEKVLRENYEEHIGLGKWVSRYAYNKAIASSKYTTEMKKKLKHFGELVGQSKSVRYALNQFISGKTIGKASDKHSVIKGVDVNDHKAVRQRKKLFSDYIKRIRALGIQPMRLTDKDGSELNNPFADGSFTLKGHWFSINKEDDLNYIVDVPVGVLPRIQHLATNLEIEKIHAKHVEKAVKDEEER